ncbi:hypothetical protein [Candidatus Bathycorpusculum sp.]|uniref:hypothetical protein n=1 Tax=Candidatus Bathycorpusculum sp. TaxID=2994959 RepID=UPI002833D73A|nr:hypothetical protein [Candidatus Termitimicrobium sp.]MCL2686007.1 hypothetical protein [Candidatus Termitimicrobium sp.]
MTKVIALIVFIVITDVVLFSTAISCGLIPLTYATTSTTAETATTANNNLCLELQWAIITAIFIPLISSLSIIAVWIKKMN